MAKVTGIGGIFYKVDDPAATRKWYADVLGVPTNDYCWIFEWREHDAPTAAGQTVWCPFPETTDHFAPSQRPFMINLRVDDLDGVLARLKARGVQQVGPIIDDAQGRFAHVIDPDGVKVELWQPSAAASAGSN
jgi:lactoylglutathione lyase